MKEQPTDITLGVARLGALCCFLAATPYAAMHIEPSPVVSFCLSAVPLLAVILWLERDAQRTRVGAVQDLGYFLLIAWPAVIPWYAFKTRGRQGWQLAVGLFGLIEAAYIGRMLVGYVVWFRG